MTNASIRISLGEFPPVVNLKFLKGYDMFYGLTFELGLGFPSPLEGNTITLEVKNAGRTEVVFTASTNDYITVTGNIVHISIPADISDTLSWTYADYRLGVEGVGYKHCLVQGSIRMEN